MQGHIREMAALLQGMGRGGDTILAHINPQEAMLLDAVTDGGSINPVTGMPEFFMGGYGDPEELGIGEPGENPQSTGGDNPGDPYGGDDPTGPQFENEFLSYPLNYGIRGLGAQYVPNPRYEMPTNQVWTRGYGQTGLIDKYGITGGYTDPTPGQLSALNTYITNNPYQAPSSFLDTLKTAVTGAIEIPPNIVGVDLEFTGKDLFGGDLSRALAGRPGNQPAMSAEINPLGIVGGAAADFAGALVGGAISPTVNVDTSGNVTTHGGIGNTIDQISDFVDNPPDIVSDITNLPAEIADVLGITTTPTDEQQIASNAAPSPLSLTMEPPATISPEANMQPLGSPVDVQPAQTMPNLGPMDAAPQPGNNAPYTVVDEFLDKTYDVVTGIPNFIATLPDRLSPAKASIPGQQASTNTGIPPNYFEESNDPFFQTPLQMTSPQQVAEQIIAQQELVNALTQPGYTRAGQGRIYL